MKLIWQAKVQVGQKPDILNPEAREVKKAITESLKQPLTALSMGKWFELTFQTPMTQEEAEAATKAVCQDLLCNEVMEIFSFQVSPAANQLTPGLTAAQA